MPSAEGFRRFQFNCWAMNTKICHCDACGICTLWRRLCLNFWSKNDAAFIPCHDTHGRPRFLIFCCHLRRKHEHSLNSLCLNLAPLLVMAFFIDSLLSKSRANWLTIHIALVGCHISAKNAIHGGLDVGIQWNKPEQIGEKTDFQRIETLVSVFCSIKSFQISP